MPRPIAEKHRRHSLFLYLCLFGVFGMVGTTGLIAAGVLDERFFLLQIAFLVISCVVSPAARRVDDTHRRRKWFD